MKSRFFAVLFATLIIGCGTSTSLNTETKLFDRPSTFFIRPSAEVQSLNKITGPRYVFPERDFRGEIVSINLRLPNLWWEMNEQFPSLNIKERNEEHLLNFGGNMYFRMPMQTIESMEQRFINEYYVSFGGYIIKFTR